MKRREFLEITSSAAATGALAVLAGCDDQSTRLAGPLFAGKPGSGVTRVPLHVPPTVAPSALTLQAAPGTADSAAE